VRFTTTTSPPTDWVYTITTTSTAATDLTFTVLKARSPEKMPPKPPEPVPFRDGDAVRVTAEGILQGRVGTVSGFMEADGRRIVFVSWPAGGWTTFAEGSLQRAGKKKKEEDDS
jgi:hypothetical protein